MCPIIPRIRLVRSFDELMTTRFANGVNALCWPRTLEGDFAEVVTKLDVGRGITHLDAGMLHALSL
ncbi:MAG TPA: hypothetical protein PLB55_22215, partial [Prosthecobacter sp.]|nr:hypothetical protein [Prosthecobacter sp.]